jgi:NADH-quinone oxidoreductase chain G
MLSVIVDGVEVEVERGSTVLQACEAVGIEIPRFCYHERLSIAGNCRMCLVEIFKTPKPVASCAMPTMEGMQIFTHTPLVKKAREAVLEFLLLNHPLDCPICDQGGECDLQDQAMAFGSDRSRFYETKRGVENKNCGPLIKTIMTRCIHCTRCVRFATELAGVEDLGTTGRGRETEIGTYIEKTFRSELSGNVIDLCPVGALTSKPYAFLARPWEVMSTESIDLSDSWGSPIRVDSRGQEILRVLPRPSSVLAQEEWISDKTRFSFDGLKNQRLNRPYFRRNGKLHPTSWTGVLRLIQSSFKCDDRRIHGRLGKALDSETSFIAQDLFDALDSPYLSQEESLMGVDSGLRTSYTSDLFPQGKESELDIIRESSHCLLIGTDPRYEAPLLNLLLREAVLHRGTKVGLVGSPVDLTFPLEHLGNSLSSLARLAEGKDPFAKGLAQDPSSSVIIVGSKCFESKEGEQVAHLLSHLASSSNVKIHYLPSGANTVGQLDLGINEPTHRFEDKAPSVLYLLGTDEEVISPCPNTFVIYQGSHGDRNAELADLIIPTYTFTEKEATYVNCLGSSQKTKFVTKGPKEATEDWIVLHMALWHLDLAEDCTPIGKMWYRDLLSIMNTPLWFSDEESEAPIVDIYGMAHEGKDASNMLVNREKALTKRSYTFYPQEFPRNPMKSLKEPYQFSFDSPQLVSRRPLEKKVLDFYKTDALTRASRTMTECSLDFQDNASNFFERG